MIKWRLEYGRRFGPRVCHYASIHFAHLQMIWTMKKPSLHGIWLRLASQIAGFDVKKTDGKVVKPFLYEILVHGNRLELMSSNFQSLAKVVRELMNPS